MTRFEQLYGIALTKRRRTELMIALMALEVVFAFSYLGFIILPPISITTMHLLALFAAMVLGTKESVAVAMIFALTSMWQATVSGVQYSDVIFSPSRSGMPMASLLLNAARPLAGFVSGVLFDACFAQKRKHVYGCIALTVVASTWVYGTLTYLDTANTAWQLEQCEGEEYTYLLTLELKELHILPSTGGAGTVPFTLAGAALMAVAVLLPGRKKVK